MESKDITTSSNWLTRLVSVCRQALTSKPFWSDVIIFLCGLLFLYSALDKFAEYNAFRIQVGKSPILTGWENVIVWSIPSLEILIVLLMIPLATRRIGLYAFFTLMLLFTGYIALLLQDGTTVPCGCNALTEKLSLEAHIVMNLAFSVVAAVGVFISPKPDFTLLHKHPIYRRLVAPVGSRIRSMVARLKRKEAHGNED